MRSPRTVRGRTPITPASASSAPSGVDGRQQHADRRSRDGSQQGAAEENQPRRDRGKAAELFGFLTEPQTEDSDHGDEDSAKQPENSADGSPRQPVTLLRARGARDGRDDQQPRPGPALRTIERVVKSKCFLQELGTFAGQRKTGSGAA